jgi:nucleotide-binding universal stress UspA family protein
MTEIRSILFPSDLSLASDQAFEHVRLLAEAFEARVTLFHAVPLPRAEYAQFLVNEEQVWRVADERARQHLEGQARSLRVPHEVIVRHDVSAVPLLVDLAILDLMKRRRPDLTVMATSCRKGLSGFLLGSVVQQVILSADRPVLCVRNAKLGPLRPYRRLMVTTDLSAASRLAFPLTAVLAGRFGASVTALHVRRAEGQRPTVEELRAFLDPDFAGLTVETRVSPAGPAWHRIVEVAGSDRADLVVMATCGHDSVRDGILGSNTERVLRHAPCPVLAA